MCFVAVVGVDVVAAEVVTVDETAGGDRVVAVGVSELLLDSFGGGGV